MRDLVVLVADKNMQHALQGVLSRPKALGIRSLQFEILTHPNRDGGVRTSGAQILALRRRTARHALMLLDFEGSGSSGTAAQLEHSLNESLRSVWDSNAQAVVIEPELDVWAWGAENALRDEFGWTDAVSIRDWLRGRGYQFDARGKPLRPKEALEAVMRELRMPRSSAVYKALASRLSLCCCEDPAFKRVRSALSRWFAA